MGQQAKQPIAAFHDERALSGPWFAVRKRLPWLHINLVTALLAVALGGLVLREIGPRHWPRVLAKEAATGTINGIAIAPGRSCPSCCAGWAKIPRPHRPSS